MMEKYKKFREGIENNICPICGEDGFEMLGLHTNQAHGISADEYRKIARVPKNTPLCSEEYSEKSKQKAVENNNIEMIPEEKDGRNKSKKDKIKQMQSAEDKTNGEKYSYLHADRLKNEGKKQKIKDEKLIKVIKMFEKNFEENKEIRGTFKKDPRDNYSGYYLYIVKPGMSRENKAQTSRKIKNKRNKKEKAKDICEQLNIDSIYHCPKILDILSEEIGVSKRTVSRYLRIAEERGFIRRRSREWKEGLKIICKREII